MKLEEGKYYRTADGRKVGPMRFDAFVWYQDGCEQLWNGDGTVMHEAGDESHDYIIAEEVDHYHVIYRAQFNMTHDYRPELAERVFPVKKNDTPKLWRDMTPEEKGALLLAHHEGKVIEANDGDGWWEVPHPGWSDTFPYRVRPVAQPPVRITVDLLADLEIIGTIDLIDGKPDPESIRMEELE